MRFCLPVLERPCKCNEGHLGFMKTPCSASHRWSNMAFFIYLFNLFVLNLHVSVDVCMCNWVFFWCVSFFACLPVEWKNGKLKITLC